MKFKIKLNGFKCLRCGHKWLARKFIYIRPRMCPKCKNTRWDISRNKKSGWTFTLLNNIAY